MQNSVIEETRFRYPDLLIATENEIITFINVAEKQVKDSFSISSLRHLRLNSDWAHAPFHGTPEVCKCRKRTDVALFTQIAYKLSQLSD